MHNAARTWQIRLGWLGVALGSAGLAVAVLAGDRLKWEFRAMSASVGFTIIVVGLLLHQAAGACQRPSHDTDGNQKQ